MDFDFGGLFSSAQNPPQNQIAEGGGQAGAPGKGYNNQGGLGGGLTGDLGTNTQGSVREKRVPLYSKFYEYAVKSKNHAPKNREAAENIAFFCKTRHQAWKCEYCGGPHGRSKCKHRLAQKTWFGKDVKIAAILKLFEAQCQ